MHKKYQILGIYISCVVCIYVLICMYFLVNEIADKNDN